MPDLQKSQNWNELLQKNIRQSMLLSQEEKTYWLGLLPQLPPLVVKLISEQIQNANQQVDQFIKLALSEDTAHQFLDQLKTVITKTEKNIHGSKEISEQKEAEKILKQKLKEI